MSAYDHYRDLAAKARRDAQEATLPKIREQNLRSAERFDEILRNIITAGEAKARNEAAKSELETGLANVNPSASEPL